MVLVQTDFKKMVAYSSVSHMGICILGVFSFNLYGQQGGLLTMINHGLSTGALFLIVGMFYERVHTRDLSLYGGAVAKMPVLGLLFLPVALSSMGVPGTNGFVNEFLVLWGAFVYKPMAGFLAAIGIILAAAYMLRLTQRVMLGPLGSDLMGHLTDLDLREKVALGVLVVFILWLGIFPNPMLSRMEPSLQSNLFKMAGLAVASR
jgi:NADH-quinone oxidoreductase subunit M